MTHAAAAGVSSLPRGARVWVFTADRPLTADDAGRLHELMTRVYGVWAKKSPDVRGVHEIVESRFLVVGADESRACVSGCGIDAMMQWMKQLAAESGLRLIDRLRVFWRAEDGTVRSAPRAEFQRLLDTGAVTLATHVFDTAAALSDVFLDGRFELPLAASWHAQVFTAR